MQTRASLLSASVFGGVALSGTVLLYGRWLEPLQAVQVAWLPTLLALLLGAALGSPFARTTRLRLGLLYAAALGCVVGVPTVLLQGMSYAVVSARMTESELWLGPFSETAAQVEDATATFSEGTDNSKGLPLVWLFGPLTGLVVWTLLRRPKNAETTSA